MGKGRTQWYIGAPNGVILCVNGTDRGQLSGELWHSYSAEPVSFLTIEQMMGTMEKLYDWLSFPYRGTNRRSFTETEPRPVSMEERNKIMSDINLLSKHGDLGTFIVRVQHRQNSSWQGRITWMEEDKTIQFRSVWEMIKLIESAVDTVSEPEDPADAAWFSPEDRPADTDTL